MRDSAPGFRILDHTADIALEATGADLRELFANAARGMFEITIDPKTVRAARTVPVRAEGADLVDVLVSWLGELLFQSEAKSFFFRDVTVAEADERHVSGEAAGEPIDLARHHPGMEIKAVTYHECEVRRDERTGRWRATVLFDI